MVEYLSIIVDKRGKNMYYYDVSYIFYMIISLSVSLYAHFKVKHAFNKYSKVECSKNITGVESAERVLRHNKVRGVSIGKIYGYFNDHYDSRTNNIALSENVYSKRTVASLSVAAHEAGHAVQNAVGYVPLKIRHSLVPVVQIGSNLAMPLVFIGLALPVKYSFVVNAGIMLYSLAVLFQLVTLPVEFNASHRAFLALKETGMINAEEEKGVKEVLGAAAFTYVAAMFTSLLSLLRLIFISRRRRD